MRVSKEDGGTLDGPMQFLLYSDNNNKPGTVLAGTGAYEISHANVPTSDAWTDALWTGTDNQRPFLTAGVRYWIVLNTAVITGDDLNNYYRWARNNVATGYTSGKAMFKKSISLEWQDGYAMADSADGGVAAQMDMCFKIYRGVDGGASSSFIYEWETFYTPKYL
jgi:hypothetical protein